jgi:hypothetical protein
MLDKLLEKLGVKSIDDLKPAERDTYRQWAQLLAKADVTIEDLKGILPKELERANHELHSHENSEKKDSYLKAYCELLEWLTKTILTPAKERDALRAHLKNKFNLD